MCCNEEGYNGAISQEGVLFVGLHTAKVMIMLVQNHCRLHRNSSVSLYADKQI